MTAIPFTLFSDRQLEQIQALLHGRASGWTRRQLGAAGVIGTPLQHAYQCNDQLKSKWNASTAGYWRVLSITHRNIGLKVSADQSVWLAAMGYEQDDIASEEWACLVEAMANHFLLEVFPQEAREKCPRDALGSAWVRGAGVLYWQLRLNGIEFELLFNGHLLAPPGAGKTSGAGTERERKKLQSRVSAVQSYPIGLVASLGSIDISIGELSRIAVGDIIKFDRLFTDKVDILNCKGQWVCSGSLGKKDKHRAVMAAADKQRNT